MLMNVNDKHVTLLNSPLTNFARFAKVLRFKSVKINYLRKKG